MEQEKIKLSDEQYEKLSQDYFIELGWNDPEKKDSLVIVSKKPFKEVMAANAKGTTIYELIDLYGGVDGVQKVFPGTSSMYGDSTGVPEMFSPEELENMAHKMSEYAKTLKEKANDPSSAPEQKEVKKGENEEQTGSVTGQEVK